MKTPITDSTLDEWANEGTARETIIPAMRRLETDRAALLEFAIRVRNTTSSTRIKREATAAIAESRANFPD